jgi:hypothetical protein
VTSSRTTRNVVIAATFLGVGCVATLARAEELTVPGPRQGYYLGGGAQVATIRSHDKDLGRLSAGYGSAFSLRLGEMVTPWLGVGVELGGGQAANSRWSQGFGGLLLDVQLVPWRSLAIHGSAGLGAILAKDQKKLVTGSKGTGGAYYGAGVRYDLFPFYESGSGGFGITPGAEVRYLPGSGFNTTMFWVGVDLLWWRGLDKQELELAPDQAFTHGA